MAARRTTGSNSAGSLVPEDWVDAAIRRLVRGGIDSVGVQQLARDLHVTKGSFYWHFRNREALLAAVLKRWRGVTVELNHLLESEEPDPSQRLSRLLYLPEHTPDAVVAPADFELAVRSWARHSARAASTVKRVDALREHMFVRMFQELGAAGGHALILARICLAVAGRLWRWEEVRGAERLALIQTTHKLLIDACIAPHRRARHLRERSRNRAAASTRRPPHSSPR
jgi:AcrR family transcriptional regulator